jgi:hypothetical protein
MAVEISWGFSNDSDGEVEDKLFREFGKSMGSGFSFGGAE